MFSLWDSDENDVDQFIEQANKFHQSVMISDIGSLILNGFYPYCPPNSLLRSGY